MRRRLSDKFFTLVTRPDGSARFGRINAVLIAVAVLLFGLVPAFAATTTSSETATTTTAPDAPIVVGSTSSTSAASTTTAATTAPTTVPPASTTTTTSAPAPDPNREDDYMPLASPQAGAMAAASSTPSAANPPWPTSCRTNVALLLDRSSSIGDARYGGNAGNTIAVKQAASTFVRALSNKNGGTRLYVNAFATYIRPVYQWFGHTYLVIPPTEDPLLHASAAKAITAINETPFATGDPYPSDYGTGGGRGRTNWQGAMADVPAGARLVIMITDGEPTWWNGANWSNNDGSTQPEDVTQAIHQANALKASGARVVAVHIGNDRSGRANLRAISGPTEGSDYFYSSYADLNDTLARIGARTCTVDNPAITIAKTANKNVAKAGDTVAYSFKVTNTGNVTLNNVAVTDDVLGNIGTIDSLAAGANRTLTKNFTVPANKKTVTNTGRACGRASGETVCDTDDHTLTVISIKIEKTADKATAKAADKVTYSFKVTNTSNVTLNNVVVTDNVLGTIGTINSLAAGADQTLTKEYTVPANKTAITNTGKACGQNGGVTVCDTDNHTLTVVSIKVEKSADKPSAVPGDEVVYSFKVTNTSTVTLTNITVKDDVLGDIGTIASLAAGASTTLTKEYTVPEGSGEIVNTVTVCAPIPGSTSDPVETVCGTDTHTLPRLSIGLTKTPSVDTAEVGQTIVYTYVVTNTSSVTLKNLALTDDKLGDIDLAVTTLAPGASTTGTAQYTVKTTDAAPANPTGFITNVATVGGEDDEGNEVQTTATARVGVVGGIIESTSTTSTTTGVRVGGQFLASTGAGTSTLFPLALILTIGGAILVGVTRLRRRSAMDGQA